MRDRLRLIRLTVRHARLLVAVPAAIAWVILPSILIVGQRTGTQRECVENLVCNMETLLPLCGLMWSFAYLRMWINHEGEEAMRVCRRRKTCAADLLILDFILFLVILPLFMALYLTWELSWFTIIRAEALRLAAQILLFSAVFYFISVLTWSVALGGMLVTAYHMFCILFARYSEMRAFCLIRPDILAEEEGFPFLGVLAAALILYLAGAVIELFHSIMG
ncbi:MAG: hypothetical protein LUF34_08790 [Lachnospiraceae bacterium]|nr:hypothetical protein [Lachnospiraceae bacterium]